MDTNSVIDKLIADHIGALSVANLKLNAMVNALRAQVEDQSRIIEHLQGEQPMDLGPLPTGPIQVE